MRKRQKVMEVQGVADGALAQRLALCLTALPCLHPEKAAVLRQSRLANLVSSGEIIIGEGVYVA